MIDLLEQHLLQLRAAITEPELAVAPIRPYLRPNVASPALRDGLLDAPLRIPDLLRALADIIAQHDDPRVRGFAGGIYAYVFNPIDIIPEDEAGYVGFVEDAVICWLGLRFLRDRYQVRVPAELVRDDDPLRLAWEALASDVRTAIEEFFRQFELSLEGLSVQSR